MPSIGIEPMTFPMSKAPWQLEKIFLDGEMPYGLPFWGTAKILPRGNIWVVLTQQGKGFFQRPKVSKSTISIAKLKEDFTLYTATLLLVDNAWFCPRLSALKYRAVAGRICRGRPYRGSICRF